MKNAFFYLIFFAFAGTVNAQNDTLPAWTFSGYLEPYYGYDFSRPADGNRPAFVYSHHRHHEFNINIGLLKAAYAGRFVRGNLALMAGTYANANLAAEPATLRNVYEANAGVKLSNKYDLWLDAGIFSSHIGFESAIGKDCWTLTRSIVADNSPYYEAGAKLSYTSPDGKWLLAALALNGWQRIQRVSGNSTLSAGTQVQYKPGDRITLNSSTFFGSDKPDSLGLWRVYHNLYGQFQLSETIGLILGLDTGWEENARPGETANFWYTPVAIARFTLKGPAALAFRAEYYRDENGVIIPSDASNGFQTLGLSANLDVALREHALWRLEGKWLKSADAVFQDHNGRPTDQNALLATALCVWF